MIIAFLWLHKINLLIILLFLPLHYVVIFIKIIIFFIFYFITFDRETEIGYKWHFIFIKIHLKLIKL